jgi:succinate dehydrogenase / fumarate reductase iron-sulfur subunit
MAETNWSVKFLIHRKKGSKPPRFDAFQLDVNPDEYILDAIERIWAFHDRTLVFRHACHHSVCGACGMRVNGVEKLTCITSIHSVVGNGGQVKVEPLRNFPVISDLTVDMGSMYRRLEEVGFQQVVPIDQAPAPNTHTIARAKVDSRQEEGMMRLVDCIECGMCISACPIATTTPEYMGPAVLAGAQHRGLQQAPELLELVDNTDGVWRCHSAYECTAVCPSNVEPGWRIMDLRRQVVTARFRRLFGA